MPHSPPALIVGAGLAGLTASLTLLSLNRSVILLERAARPGGNSIKASSGINGASTRYQSPDVSDSADLFYADTIRSAGGAMRELVQRREALARKVTNESSDAIEWLVDKNIDLSRVAQLGGHSAARTHRGGGGTPPGWAIISSLLKEAEGKPGFELRTNCEVVSLLRDEKIEKNRVTGLLYRSSVSPSSPLTPLYGPVILASGGFAGDAGPDGELGKWRPDLAEYPSTNEARKGAVGMLHDIGAKMVDMQSVQVHPTGFVDPSNTHARVKILAAEVLRGEGGILLRGGRRFVDELGTREFVTGKITEGERQRDGDAVRQWDVQILLDEGAYLAAKTHVDFYVAKGLMRKTRLSDLGRQTLETVTAYAKSAKGEAEDPLGRTHFANWKLIEPKGDSVVWVGSVTPVVHFTMGGALISERAEVLGEDEGRIEGLWGAGEVTGGVHGDNRLGGSSLLECVVFGRIAGEECARYVYQRS